MPVNRRRQQRQALLIPLSCRRLKGNSLFVKYQSLFGAYYNRIVLFASQPYFRGESDMVALARQLEALTLQCQQHNAALVSQLVVLPI